MKQIRYALISIKLFVSFFSVQKIFILLVILNKTSILSLIKKASGKKFEI